jgi:hypothetical protein
MVGAACLGALAIAVGGGVLAAHVVARGERVGPGAVRVVRAGAATLAVPRGWRTVALRDAGAPVGTTAVFAPSPDAHDRVIVTVAPAEDPSLVPAALRGLVRDLGRGPRATRLGGHRAWRYVGLPGRNREDVLDVTLLPTTAGVLGIACVSAVSAAGATANCASSIGSVSISSGAMLVPSGELALRLRLPRVLAVLDRARVRFRAALVRAGTGAGQARLAGRLAREHLAGADSLHPVAGRAGGPLLDALSNVAGAYRELGRAASAGSASGFHAARGTVQTAEAGLAAAIDRLGLRDAREPAVAPPTRSSPGRPDAPGLVLVLVLFLGLLALGLAVLRSRRAPAAPPRGVARSPDAPAPAAAAWSDAPSPTAAGPTVARHAGWDAPPTPPPPATAGVGAVRFESNDARDEAS